MRPSVADGPRSSQPTRCGRYCVGRRTRADTPPSAGSPDTGWPGGCSGYAGCRSSAAAGRAGGVPHRRDKYKHCRASCTGSDSGDFEVISSQQSAIIRYYILCMKNFKQISYILTHLEIITENDGFFMSRWYAIPEYPTGVFGAITAGRGGDFLGLSIHGNPDPHFVFATKDTRTTTHPPPAQESFCIQQVVASLQGVGAHSPVLLTRRSMFGARPQTPVQSHAYWIFLDKRL